MKTQIENPALANSRFRFDELLFLDINFHQFNLTRGSSYLPLPGWVSRKGGVNNPRNENTEECFKWAVTAALDYVDTNSHAERIPEKKNDVIVNVLGVEEKKVYILRGKKHDYRKKVANLLLIADSERRHYTLIKSLSRLLRSSNSKYKCKQHFCLNCLQVFQYEESGDKHFEYCKDNESVRTEMSKENSFVKFHIGQYQCKVPFIMYADFESIVEPIKSPNPNPEESYTKVINQHIPSGFCMKSKFAYGKVENPIKLYRENDCVEVFCDYISNEARRLYHMFAEKPMKPLTREQWRKFNRATKCHICLKGLKEDYTKVRDHCHFTGS